MLFLPLVLVFGCSGSSKDTSSTANPDSEADADTDADSDADADSDSEPVPTASIAGSVVGYDGSTPADVEVQVCDLVCFSVSTTSGGAFVKDALEAGSYKVDAIGTSLGGDMGTIRMHVDLADDEQLTIPAPLYMPQVVGPHSFSQSGASFGSVMVMADPSIMTVPFGYEDGQFWAGVVPGEQVPPFWGVTPSVAVAFLPIATEVAGSFGVHISGAYPAGNYDVYSVDDHGSVEGPVGTATSDGSMMMGDSLSPKFLTWLLFVPK